MFSYLYIIQVTFALIYFNLFKKIQLNFESDDKYVVRLINKRCHNLTFFSKPVACTLIDVFTFLQYGDRKV